LDHRQRHALHAVAEHADVAALDLVQALPHPHVLQVDVARDDGLELELRLVEVVLAAPEGVVGVEADHFDPCHRASMSRFGCGSGAGSLSLRSHPAAGILASPATRYGRRDRKSTRLNSSHVKISYAVFCLK